MLEKLAIAAITVTIIVAAFVLIHDILTTTDDPHHRYE